MMMERLQLIVFQAKKEQIFYKMRRISQTHQVVLMLMAISYFDGIAKYLTNIYIHHCNKHTRPRFPPLVFARGEGDCIGVIRLEHGLLHELVDPLIGLSSGDGRIPIYGAGHQGERRQPSGQCDGCAPAVLTMSPLMPLPWRTLLFLAERTNRGTAMWTWTSCLLHQRCWLCWPKP
jgi:hypothetical protein